MNLRERRTMMNGKPKHKRERERESKRERESQMEKQAKHTDNAIEKEMGKRERNIKRER